jgi:hypothetical protein
MRSPSGFSDSMARTMAMPMAVKLERSFGIFDLAHLVPLPRHYKQLGPFVQSND